MKIYFNDYDKETLEKAETLLFNGNGHIGFRANLEEEYYDFFSTNRETYINGFYETKSIQYPEKMHGFTPTGETMISVVDGQTTLITIGDERFSILTGEISRSERYVDLDRGMTVRKLIWTSPKGRETKIKITRFASFTDKSLFVANFDFEKLNHDEPIKLETHLNFTPIKTIDKDDPRMGHEIHSVIKEKVDLAERTCGFHTENSNLHGEIKWQFNGVSSTISEEPTRIVISSELTGKSFTKMLSYRFANYEHEGLDKSYEQLLNEQTDYLRDFWEDARIEIESDLDLEESVNYGTYALLQSLGTNGTTSIAAKGLSGSGYEGHYFWDTEMYIFPLFLTMRPDLAKSILQYRINTLEKAKENRKIFGYQTGALYPWRTISGTESSAFFEAGSAQHHINSDIAYAFINYFIQTNDYKFMFSGGFEVLLETARVFLEIGYFKEDAFHIDKVTGPDEYTVLVNDNYYTNRMVKHQFEWVVRLADILADQDINEWQELSHRLNISVEELATMTEAAQKMATVIDEEKNVIAQDRDFLNKDFWPYTKEETKYPLLLNYHPLVIYRYQVLKQADTVLALMLFPEDYSDELVNSTTTYYDTITTHDSSLSFSAYGTVYARLNEPEKSYEYFLKNARTDLDNLHHNTKDGIHSASMGGTFMNILYGFCNLKVQDNELVLRPHLPKEIRKISFNVNFQGDKYRVEVNQDGGNLIKTTK